MNYSKHSEQHQCWHNSAVDVTYENTFLRRRLGKYFKEKTNLIILLSFARKTLPGQPCCTPLCRDNIASMLRSISPGASTTAWSNDKRHARFVYIGCEVSTSAIGKPERQVCKAWHCSSKRDHPTGSLHFYLFAPHTYGCCSSRTSRSW